MSLNLDFGIYIYIWQSSKRSIRVHPWQLLKNVNIESVMIAYPLKILCPISQVTNRIQHRSRAGMCSGQVCIKVLCVAKE